MKESKERNGSGSETTHERKQKQDIIISENKAQPRDYRGSDEEESIIGSGVGQGELYSPEYALRIDPDNSNGATMIGYLSAVKERLMEKLAAAGTTAEALDRARQMLESSVRDASAAAQSLTKDALQRIKTRLLEILPSLSPSLASQMVDDADKEANSRGERDNKTIAECEQNLKDPKEKHDQESTSTPIFTNNPSSKL